MISLRGKIFQIEEEVNDYWRDEEFVPRCGWGFEGFILEWQVLELFERFQKSEEAILGKVTPRQIWILGLALEIVGKIVE